MTRRELISLLQSKGVKKIWGHGLHSRSKLEILEFLAHIHNRADGTVVRHLSYSQVAQFRKCGMQWFFQRVDPNAPKYPSNAAMHQGKAHGIALAQGLEEQRDSGDPNITAMTDLYVQTLQDDEDVDWTGADKNSVEGSGVALVKIYRNTVMPRIVNVDAVEEKELVTFENVDYDLMVIPDAVVDESDGDTMLRVVLDHKRSAKTKPANEADASEQLSAYALSHFVRTGRLPDIVRLDVAVGPLRGSPKAETLKRYSHIEDSRHGYIGLMKITSVRTMADIDYYLGIMGKTAEAMERGVYLHAAPGAWWCSEKCCDYWGYCHETL